MSCPVCNILKGDLEGAGNLCGDCSSNQKLVDEWMWYGIIKRHIVHYKIFVVVYPLLMVAGCAAHLMNWFTTIICVGSFGFNTWMYGRKNYQKLVAEQREKLFVMKLEGVHRRAE